MAQVIHWVFDPIQLKPRTVEDNQQNCYIGLFLRNKMEWKVVNPVQYIPPHFVKIYLDSKSPLYGRKTIVCLVWILPKKGNWHFHIYVGGQWLEEVDKFCLTKMSRYDQVFVNVITIIADKLQPCLQYSIWFCSVSPGSTVPIHHKWFNAHKCMVLMPLIPKPSNVTCRHCQHNIG